MRSTYYKQRHDCKFVSLHTPSYAEDNLQAMPTERRPEAPEEDLALGDSASQDCKANTTATLKWYKMVLGGSASGKTNQPIILLSTVRPETDPQHGLKTLTCFS